MRGGLIEVPPYMAWRHLLLCRCKRTIFSRPVTCGPWRPPAARCCAWSCRRPTRSPRRPGVKHPSRSGAEPLPRMHVASCRGRLPSAGTIITSAVCVPCQAAMDAMLLLLKCPLPRLALGASARSEMTSVIVLKNKILSLNARLKPPLYDVKWSG